MILNSAIGIEQRWREGAKKEPGNGKFRGNSGSPDKPGPSGFGGMPAIPLASIFTASSLRCLTLPLFSVSRTATVGH